MLIPRCCQQGIEKNLEELGRFANRQDGNDRGRNEPGAAKDGIRQLARQYGDTAQRRPCDHRQHHHQGRPFVIVATLSRTALENRTHAMVLIGWNQISLTPKTMRVARR